MRVQLEDQLRATQQALEGAEKGSMQAASRVAQLEEALAREEEAERGLRGLYEACKESGQVSTEGLTQRALRAEQDYYVARTERDELRGLLSKAEAAEAAARVKAASNTSVSSVGPDGRIVPASSPSAMAKMAEYEKTMNATGAGGDVAKNAGAKNAAETPAAANTRTAR